MSVQLPRPNNIPSALHVADYMLATAKLDYGLNLDQLQLNKLLYITNGFVLRERDDPAFHNDVEAWKYGPVIRTVWETYRSWGKSSINRLEMCYTSLDDRDAVAKRRMELFKIIDKDIAGIVAGVLQDYGRCAGGEMVKMTHKKGTPWHKVYRPGHDNVIPTKLIAKFYRQLSKYDDAR